MKTGIALFVYNRPEHTKKVLDGLKKNNIGKLYIFHDGLKEKGHENAWRLVGDLINKIDWCETEILTSEVNKGLSESIIYGVNYVLNKNERIIVLEDDCVPQDNFVGFMKKCFDKYENEDRIMSIGGYSWPFNLSKNYNYDTYFLYRFSSWGWGTWRKKWIKFKKDYEIIRRINSSEELKYYLDYAGSDLIEILKDQVLGKANSWAVFWALNIIENKGICVSPVKSFIKNIGFDGSGVNCGKTTIYDTELEKLDIESIKFPHNIEVDSEVANNFKEFISGETLDKKLKVYYEMLLEWIGKINDNKNVVDHLKNNKIESIAIYGAGKVGINFLNSINGNINVKCFINQSITGDVDRVQNIQIVDIDNFVENYYVDCIIVTPVYEFEAIKKNLIESGVKSKIVSLKQIIHDL